MTNLRSNAVIALVFSPLVTGPGPALAQDEPPAYDGSPSGSNLDSRNAIALPDPGLPVAKL